MGTLGFESIGLIGSLGIIFIVGILFIVSRYKRCPSNKIIVVYGKVSGNKTAKCVHGGGVLVLPLIQDYSVLSLEPMTIDIDLRGALSKKNIRVAVPSTFTIGISTDEKIMYNAAERILGIEKDMLINQASDIILGQLRLVIATLSIEEINQDREKFLDLINSNVNIELNKIGLEVINVNVRDIKDESGYIEAIGKKAAAEAINKAKVEVAQQEKLGTVGEAEANREKEISVAQQIAQTQIGKAEADKKQKVQVAAFGAQAIEGENTAKGDIAQYNANLVVKQAQAERDQQIGIAQQKSQTEIGKAEADKKQRIQVAAFEAESVQGENTAKAEIAEYNATLSVKQAEALRLGEVARAQAERDVLKAQKEKEVAKLQKEELAKKEVEKMKIEVEANAEAEKQRIIAAGQADAIKAKYFAEAEGIKAVLNAKADGYEKLVKLSPEKPEIATSFLMIEKMEQIVAKQVDAIKNIKFDKITVWDGGNGKDGTGTTANFLKGLIKSLPALHDLAEQAGIELPKYLGKVEDNIKNNTKENIEQSQNK
jgi:flotillin